MPKTARKPARRRPSSAKKPVAAPPKRLRGRPKGSGKAAEQAEKLLKMLSRPGGATAGQVAQAFNWQNSSARARISTMLRGQGIKIERTLETRAGVKVNVYRALPQLPLGEGRRALRNRTIRAPKEDRAV